MECSESESEKNFESRFTVFLAILQARAYFWFLKLYRPISIGVRIWENVILYCVRVVKYQESNIPVENKDSLEIDCPESTDVVTSQLQICHCRVTLHT